MAQTNLFSSQAGHGDDLVLLHGWGLNSQVWHKVLPLLTPYYRVHCLDLPGFGESEWAAELTDIKAISDRIGAYIEANCCGPAYLLGWSMGGLIATSLALRQPALVQQLMTVASSPRFVAGKDWPGIDSAVLADFQTQLSADLSATLKRFLAVQTMGSPHARDDMKVLRQQLLHKPLPQADALQAGLHWLQQCDFRAQLPQLSMPLNRFYGRLDSLVPMAVTRHLASGSTHIFAASAHAPFLTEAEKFAEVLREVTE